VKFKKYVEEIEPAQYALFESRLAKNSSGTIAASGLTYADLMLYHVTEYLGDRREAVTAKFPNVKNLINKVSGHPGIADYIAKRPQTPY
jgi:glutathione S-transferase